MSKPSDEDLAAEVLRYVVACQPLHQRLRDVLTQLGGLSLMTMLRREGAFDRETPLGFARDGLVDTRETLRSLAVPQRAAHHHHHMTEACRAVDRISDMLAGDPLTRGDEAAKLGLSRQLRAAADHLRFASRALPGFEMVDLSQACCAAHAAAAPMAETANELRF